MSRRKAESRGDRLGHLQGEVSVAWKQLAAYGFLLDRQADTCEGQ